MNSPTCITVTASERLGCVDLTPTAHELTKSAGIRDGALLVFSAHTTCSVLVNEWETGALEDLRRKVDGLFPTDIYYAHDDMARRTQNIVPGERRNGHAHVAQMLMGQSSQLIPIAGGELLMGRWQRVFLLELDEPKARTIVFHAFGQSSDQSRVMYSQKARPAYLPYLRKRLSIVASVADLFPATFRYFGRDQESRINLE